MSQNNDTQTETPETPETPTETPAMTGREFLAAARKAKQELASQSETTGPRYSLSGSATSFWHDQVFDRGILPTGSTLCERALRVGQNAQGLYIALNASAQNVAVMEFPKAATITFTFLQGKDEEGPFSEVGPTVCMTAPEDGIQAEPGDTICRVPLGDFQLPWLKVKVEFSGSITGGSMVCGLGYAAR